MGMNKITTKLIKDGNSIAVRLPKIALDTSVLGSDVELTFKKGEIIIRGSTHKRADWPLFIEVDKAVKDDELDDWEQTVGNNII